MIQWKVNGERRRGIPKTSYSSNITTWMSEEAIVGLWAYYRHSSAIFARCLLFAKVVVKTTGSGGDVLWSTPFASAVFFYYFSHL